MPKQFRGATVTHASGSASGSVARRQRTGPSPFGSPAAPFRGRFVPGYDRRAGYYGRFRPGGELKFFDTTISGDFNVTGAVLTTGAQLVLIPQGVTESTRVGRKCTIKSIEMVGTITSNLGAATVAQARGSGHLWLVQDMQCNGAAAGISDIIEGSNLGVGLRDLANKSRFRVLKKFYMNLNPGAGVTAALAGNSKYFHWYKKCDIPIEYSSTTGAIGEIRSNNLFLIAGVNNSNISDLINVSGKVRVRFSDA